jgi:TonB family protein
MTMMKEYRRLLAACLVLAAFSSPLGASAQRPGNSWAWISTLPANGSTGGAPGAIRFAEGHATVAGQNASRWTTEVRLRVFEGIREAGGAEATAVTSSFLKYSLSMNIEAEDDLAAEQRQIQKVFNLGDVRLLTEAALSWESPGTRDASHVFRIDGREFLVQIARGRPTRQFRIQVFEQGAKDQSSLLDTTFTIPEKNPAVFGFENTKGKPYFLLLRVTGVGGVLGGVAGGVVGGVAGGVEGGVARTIRAPKLIKEVQPIYPAEVRKAGIEGTVIIEATTDAYGRVASARILRSVPALDQAALDAVRQWNYEPMVVNGVPRPVVFTVTIRFKLDEPAGKVERSETTGVGGEEGGVSGGVAGGVAGGVEGGVEGRVGGQEYEEFVKDAVRIVGDLRPPTLQKEVAPVYPEVARQARVEGTVILEVGTNETGEVEVAKLLRSIPLLDQAAVDAVKQWKYEPFLLEGKPRKALFTVTVRFQLQGGTETTAQEEFAGDAVKATGTVKPPKLVTYVAPLYPEAARQAGVSGVVILSVKTDTTGKVVDAMVLRSVPLLDQAAIDAVKQWAYDPLVIEGKAQPVVFTVTVRFSLK